MARREHSYWYKCSEQCICGEYKGERVGGPGIKTLSYDTLKQQCSTVANVGGSSNCTGHRTRDTSRTPSKQIQNIHSSVSTLASQINTIRNMIDDEINDRLKNGHYASSDVPLNKLSDNTILSRTVTSGNVLKNDYPNEMKSVLTNLRNVCENISTDEYSQMNNAINSLRNIQVSDVVYSGNLTSIQEAVKKAVTDCICYSDCQGFSVCNCYGYCNCNY